MSRPAVTILMPLYNGARHLPETLASVARQTFTDFELLVIDDGSTDDSPRLLAEFADPRLRVIRHDRNLGLVTALNRGLAEARGEWVARQDADDLSAPGRLAAQLAFLRGNPAVPLLGCDAWLVDDRGAPRGRWRTGGHADLVSWDLCFRAPFAHSAAVFRRSIIVNRFGGYRDQPACEDLDLWGRVAEEFPVVTLREPLVKYRLHAASIMARTDDAVRRRSAVRAVLERHMETVAPGFDASPVIASAWAEALPGDWWEYFEALAGLEPAFLRGRRPAPGFARMVAEQCYALYGRAVRAGAGGAFLAALVAFRPGLLPRIPWLRMLAATVRR